MKHTVVFKNKNTYASFPLLRYIDNELTIGFFTAPRPDHTGVFDWLVLKSSDEGEAWEDSSSIRSSDDWPSMSAREVSDRFTAILHNTQIKMVTGSAGFWSKKNIFDGSETIIKSKGLFQRFSRDNWKTNEATIQRAWEVPNADVVVTFPRHLQTQELILVPAYAVLKNGLNRAMVWRSNDGGWNWRLYNMFPSEVNANEVAFINTTNGILAHVRSDTNPYIMESWSEDGIVWTYPTHISTQKDNIVQDSVIGGPSHLLKLQDGRIIDTYGYRGLGLKAMGIRAVVSEDEGISWNTPMVFRSDGGYLSSLRKRRFWQRKVWAGNDTGYPVSVQLKDDSILTTYYITTSDKITYIATTKWEAK